MRNIINSLGYDICYTARKIYQFLTKEFKDFDITPEQFVVLVKLSEENGISQMELANRLDKDKNNVKAMVDNLSKKGYLIKKENKTDKRAYSLYLTEKAKATIPKIKKHEEKFLKALTSRIELKEAKIVDEILKKICKNISE